MVIWGLRLTAALLFGSGAVGISCLGSMLERWSQQYYFLHALFLAGWGGMGDEGNKEQAMKKNNSVHTG